MYNHWRRRYGRYRRRTRVPYAWFDEGGEITDCIWLKPELVAQVEFAEFTSDGHLRHFRFCGWGEDKDPREVVGEILAGPRQSALPARFFFRFRLVRHHSLSQFFS